MNNNLFAESIRDANGEERISLRLSPEELESLAALVESPHWKIYRKILISCKTAYLDSMLPLKDPTEITKQLGIAVGINFAINQAPVLVADYRAKQAKMTKSDLE